MSGETMVGFGPKQAWLAVREGDPSAVIDALGLRDLGEVPWRHGIDLSYMTDDRVAVTPLLDGAAEHRWLLVPGRWLLGPQAATDVAALSTRLRTEVQFFATHRVIEFHRWERAVDGEVMRAFEWLGESGEVTRWHGDPDEAELAIGLSTEAADGADVLVNEADVMRIAAAWSIDPTSLDGQPAAGPLRGAAP
jgi:hypothetical protein